LRHILKILDRDWRKSQLGTLGPELSADTAIYIFI